MRRPNESTIERALEAAHDRWPTIARDGLIMTGGVTLLFGAFALLSAALSVDDDLAHLFVAAGLILISVGSVATLRIGERFAITVLTELTGGSFALALADMTSSPIGAPERYSALRLVVMLAAILIALVAFQDGFRHHELGSPGRRQPQR